MAMNPFLRARIADAHNAIGDAERAYAGADIESEREDAINALRAAQKELRAACEARAVWQSAA